MTDEYALAHPIPNGTMFVAAVEIVQYLTESGTPGYTFRSGGSVTLSSMLGLLDMAADEIKAAHGWDPMRHRHERGEDDGGL